MQYHNKELLGCPGIGEDRLIGDLMHARQPWEGIRRAFRRKRNHQGGFSEVRIGEVPKHFMGRTNHSMMYIFLMLSQHIPYTSAGPPCRASFAEVKRYKIKQTSPFLFKLNICECNV